MKAFPYAALGLLLLTGCQKAEDPLEPINDVLRSATRIQIVIPARPGLFLSSKVALPLGRDVNVVEKLGQQEFVLIYNADGVARTVVLPLTRDKFQILTDSPSISNYESRLKALQAPTVPPENASNRDGSLGGKQMEAHSAWGIKIGMTEAQVVALKGKPDSTNGNCWFYDPINPSSDLVGEASDNAIAYLPFGHMLAHSASDKVSPKKKHYVIYFSDGVVSNVVVSTL